MTLRKTDVAFILTVFKKGITTRDDHRDFGLLTYYVKTARLKDLGLIKTDGVDERNRKKWCLTEEGIEISKHYAEIEKILEILRENK
jgi:hypothetical protein